MEEEMTMTVEGQGEPGSSEEEEAAVEMPTSPTRRAQGMPKGSKNLQVWVTQVSLDDSIQPKKGRGRPKGSGSLKHRAESSKNEEEEDGDSSTPRKRGRPKGSPNKKPTLAERRDVGSEQESSDSSSDSQSPAKKGRGSPRKSLDGGGFKSSPRGRPRKDIRQRVPDDSSPAKRGRGRPKGSPMKADLPSGDPVTPKVWGRPRIYPRPETPPPPPPRGRGRPRKTDEKRGVHLRRAAPEPGAAEPTAPNDASPRRRGRPLGSVKSPRGRPKGSPNKAKAASNDAGQAEEGDDASADADEGGNPTEDM